MKVLPEQQEAQSALREVVTSIAPMLPEQRDGPIHHTPTGRRYIQILSAPEKTYQAAIEAWKVQFLSYVAKTPGNIIWWRNRPEIDGRVKVGWRVYGRLLIETL